MRTYLDCWARTAAALFAQALAGGPQLLKGLPKPLGPSAFGFAATLSGEYQGRFSVLIEGAVLESPLAGEGMDQKAGWAEILREVAEAAAGDLLARTGVKCRVVNFEPIDGESRVSQAFQLKAGDRSWAVLVTDEVRPVEQASAAAGAPGRPAGTQSAPQPSSDPVSGPVSDPVSGSVSDPVSSPVLDPLSDLVTPVPASLSAGLELLFDVELEARLRFGPREMPQGEILDLGPGDFVQLDRHVANPVDLIVGDKVVARGQVVLVNGKLGLRVTEVAAPKKRLESFRCLF